MVTDTLDLAAVDMECVTTAEALARFDQLLARVASDGARIVLTRDGREVAALVHPEDARYLQLLEDRDDNAAADAALTEIAKQGTIPWEQIEARLDRQG